MSAIELDGVRKRFGDVVALRDLSLTVDRGEVFGFLGPNGAGKSTTIDLLVDYVTPSAGTVGVLGHDVQADPLAVRRRTGILPEAFGPMRETTGREHLEFAVEARNASDDPDAVLERVGLDGDGDRLATDYSRGMAQRLALGMALVGEPDLLILDEPSTGLDSHGVRLMREIVREEADRGATVFFSSHVLEQVGAVADTVGILRAGELIAVDTIEGLRSSVGGTGGMTVTVDRPAAAVEPAVADVARVSVVALEDDALTVSCPDERKAAVIDAVRAAGADVLNVETSEPSLEDLFVAHTERSRSPPRRSHGGAR